jgi:hypothetical protein
MGIIRHARRFGAGFDRVLAIESEGLSPETAGVHRSNEAWATGMFLRVLFTVTEVGLCGFEPFVLQKLLPSSQILPDSFHNGTIMVDHFQLARFVRGKPPHRLSFP